MALQYATETGWSVAVKRVVEGVLYVVVGIVVLIVLFALLTMKDGGWFGALTTEGHHTGHIYQWMDSKLLHDTIIANKAPFLTTPFSGWLR